MGTKEGDLIADVISEAKDNTEPSVNPLEETTTESQPETVKTEPDPSPEGEGKEKATISESDNSAPDSDVPFHKHPRFQRLIKEREEERERVAKLEEQLAAFTKAQQAAPPGQKVELPKEFVELFGENPDAYPKLKSLVDQWALSAWEQKTAAQKAQEEQTQTQQKAALKEAERRLVELGEELGQDLSDSKSSLRNELLNLCETYGITDAKGLPMFDKAYELYKRFNPATQDARKKVAAKASPASATGNESTDEVFTHSKLKKMRF